MEAKEGILRLGLMGAVKSNNRNLETEDAAYKKDLQTHDQELWDKENPMPESSGEDMDVMAARDVIVQSPNQQQPPSNGVSPLMAAALAASLAAGAGGLGYGMAANKSNDETKTPVVADTDTDTVSRIQVGFGNPQ